MFLDVRVLMEFYESALGKTCARIISKKLAPMIPPSTTNRILGIGYPEPYLSNMKKNVEHLAIAMPAPQGVTSVIGCDSKNMSLLTHESLLPFPDCFFDYIFVNHVIEQTDSIPRFLNEIWRILADHGKVILLVPNRKGIWSQFSKTPFGHGRPFTTKQIRLYLEQSRFQFIARERALYFPPSSAQMILRSASTWEKTGHHFYRTFSGVLLIESRKNLYQECVTKKYKLYPQKTQAIASN